jgi:homoserine dehydrogenase
MRPTLVNNKPARPANLAVLKFGGSVLQNAQAVHSAAHEIYRYIRRGEKVLAVVSAIAGETDNLLALSRDIGGSDHAPGNPALLRLGEIRAAALLALALERIGLDSRAVDPSEIDLRAKGSDEDAGLCGLNHERLGALLEAHEVLVIPGFSGVLEDGRPALLGRGGTDLSAVYLGVALKAKRVRLIKDVDGLYASDPKSDPAPRRFKAINWDDAREICGQSIQPQALDYARKHNLRLEIAASARNYGTHISPKSASAHAHAGTQKLKVALLGFGTVGEGVYAHLQRHSDLFEISGILVRDAKKERNHAAPAHLISSDAREVFAKRPDIVVEMIGGVDAADAFIMNAFFGGADVVTANKAVMAANYETLNAAAARAGRALRYSAAVGGGVPMLEALEQVRDQNGVAAVSGVINGTANFILDRLSEGCAFEDTVKEAQEKGFAEADPSADLDGDDAAAKLCLMARLGFNAPLRPNQISMQSLSDLSLERIKAARMEGKVIRQVSEIRRDAKGGLLASVSLKTLPSDHYLCGAKGEQNRLVIDAKDGQSVHLRGKGAGRWPTAEAVMADLLDIHRLRGQYEENCNLRTPEPACA